MADDDHEIQMTSDNISSTNSAAPSNMVPNQEPVREDATHHVINQAPPNQTFTFQILSQESSNEGRILPPSPTIIIQGEAARGGEASNANEVRIDIPDQILTLPLNIIIHGVAARGGQASNAGESRTDIPGRILTPPPATIIHVGTARADNGAIAAETSMPIERDGAREEERKSRLEKLMMTMSKTTLGLLGQAIGAVVANALSSPTTSSWAIYVLIILLLLGLSFGFAGICMSAGQREASSRIIKMGAIATASAIILSMAQRLPPMVAWTGGPAALLIMAAAVASMSE